MILSELYKLANELTEILVFFRNPLPIDPTDLVILTVGVIVSSLTAAEFITGDEHRQTLGQQ